MGLKLLIFIFCAAQVFAANVYVLDGGSGDGSAWNNALDDIPSGGGTRGDTIYVGVGTYAAREFSQATSGSTVTTIKKATVADHGTSTGWNDSYAGQAVFPSWNFTTSNWTVDGATGGGPGSWNSGFGFKVEGTSSGLCGMPGTIAGITIRHTQFQSDRGATFIFGVKGTTGAVDDVLIEYCAFNEIFGPIFHINNWTDLTVQYCYWYANKSTAEDHSEGVSSIGINERCVFRWNIYHNIEGTAVFAGVNTGGSVDWRIYGNIFRGSTTPVYYYWEADPSNNKNGMTNLIIANNTIYNNGPYSQGAYVIQQGTGNVGYNNLFYNNDANAFAQDLTHNYTWAYLNIRSADGPFDKDADLVTGEANGQIGTANPFVSVNSDPLLADLHLSVNTIAGYDTTAILAGNGVDMNGITRTTFSRGALEYVAPITGRVLTGNRTVVGDRILR
jgi:hypothetical protein